MQQQSQALLPHQFAFAYKHFWDQKPGKVPWINKLHNRLRETFTQFPTWDSHWDTIPMGDPRGLSKQGSGPSYHLSQHILACFRAILKWQIDRRQRYSNILHLKSSLKTQLGNFSFQLSDHSLLHAKETNRKYNIRSKHQIPPQKARAKKRAWQELAFTANT